MEPTKPKIKTRQSGYLKQLYSTARVTAGSTHSHLKNLTTFLVNFVPTDKVDASELQVRSHFDDEEIKGLAQSIKQHGVLQPILVVQNGDRYKVVAGERRLRASKLAGIDRIPARVLTTDDEQTHEIALRENLDRVDLHPIEEGEGYLSLLESKAFKSHDDISKAFVKPKSRITECIGFTRLPDATKEVLKAQNIKNRALLRQLLNTDPQQHIEIIKKTNSRLDAIISKQIQNSAEKVKTKQKPKAKKLEFTYSLSEKGIQIPSFRWKAGEGQSKLKSYREALKKLLKETEKLVK